jgi:hypothetical protein
MRTLLSLLLLSLMLIFSACTRVVFPEPLGKPVPADDAEKFSDETGKFISGEWLGEEGSVWTVEQEPKSEYFTVKSVKKGKEETHRFLIRIVGQESREAHIIWVEDKKLNGYIPLRIAGADDALALLYPDAEAVEKMITAGKLKGVLNKDPKAWLIEKGDWEEVLAGKDFWLLDDCQPFVRRPQFAKPPEIPLTPEQPRDPPPSSAKTAPATP